MEDILRIYIYNNPFILIKHYCKAFFKLVIILIMMIFLLISALSFLLAGLPIFLFWIFADFDDFIKQVSEHLKGMIEGGANIFDEFSKDNIMKYLTQDIEKYWQSAKSIEFYIDNDNKCKVALLFDDLTESMIGYDLFIELLQGIELDIAIFEVKTKLDIYIRFKYIRSNSKEDLFFCISIKQLSYNQTQLEDFLKDSTKSCDKFILGYIENRQFKTDSRKNPTLLPITISDCKLVQMNSGNIKKD